MFSREKRLFKKLASADASFKTTLARDATAPAAVLGRLAQEDLVDIRRVVAENASTGTETLFLLSHDADRGVRDKALGRLLELSGNAKASRVLRDSAASPRLIASIAEDLSWSDVRELCGNGYDWDDRHGEFPEPSAPLLTELARVRNARVREEVAKSKHATAVILASLARDADEGVRFAVASNASTPPQTLATLLSDPAVRVRKQTLTNANLPIEALSAAVADENAEVRQQLAATTSASNGTLNQLANDESAGVRCAVARNPASPDRLLDRLSVDPEKEVRLAVALAAAPVVLFGAMTTVKNYARETPLEALSNLSADADPEVRRAAASHPRLPLETFYRLANDPDESVRNHAASVIEHGYRYPRPEQSYSTYGQEKEPSDFPTSALPALAASPHDAIRKAVAQHPLIPARLLAQLLDDGRVFDQDFSDRDKPWSSRTLMPFAVLNDLSWDTTEEWMTLAQVANPQARQTLAFSSGTPSAVLALLATDEVEYVRESLLGNYQLPAAALRKLVDDPSPAVAKKATSLLAQQTWRFRDDLGVFLDANNEKARATLARDESARREWLESLSQDPSALVRAAVAGNSNTSPTVLESLSADADPAVSSALEGAVKGGALSLESLEAVAASPHPPIRAAVASKPGLTPETLRRLVSDADESVRLSAARNGYTYGAALMDAMGMEELNRTHGIGQGSVVSLCTLAADTTLGSDPLHTLAQSPFEQVRETVAKNPSTSVPTLANLARDKSPQVREGVACHSGTPLGVLTTLAADEVAAVRGAVASNPATPAETLLLLEREPDEEVALAVALHPNTAPSSLGALVEVHAEPRLSSSNSRALSTLGPDGPLDVLAPWRRQLRDQLARSDNRWHQGVRQAVASNPSVSPEVLLRLSRQPDTVVFVARNPSAPNTVLSHLVRHSDPLVREALAAHSQMPEADLATLALDESEAVRRVVAANQHTPIPSLEILARDFSPHVREAAQSTLSLRR